MVDRHDPSGGIDRGAGVHPLVDPPVHPLVDRGDEGRTIVVVEEVRVDDRRLADRSSGLRPEGRELVLVGGEDKVVGDAEPAHERAGERRCLVRDGGARRPRVGDQRASSPERVSVGPPVHTDLPAREWLPGIPLALPDVQQPSRREPVGQREGERPGLVPLLVAVGGGHPLGRVRVLGGHERRLAALGQTYVTLGEPAIHRAPDVIDAGPLGIGVRLGDPRVLVDAGHDVGVVKLDLAGIGGTGHRGGAAGVWGARQGDVPLAAEQSRGGIEADPTGARQERLTPRVEVGEVLRRSRRSVACPLVGGELDEVARREAGGEPESTEDLHQQPRAVAARAERELQRLVRPLHAGRHASGVGHGVEEASVHVDDEVDDRPVARGVERSHPVVEQQAVLGRSEVRRQVVGQVVGVAERVALGLGLQEEVEGVDDRHVGDQVDGDRELGDRLREDQTRREVPERVLLPVDEVPLGGHGHRVRQHRGSAVGCGSQAHHVGREPDRSVEPVDGAVFERDVDAHRGAFTSARFGERRHREEGVVDRVVQ